MATVFMKWLETSPKDYDRGINLLTLGRLKRLKDQIVEKYVQPDSKVLEIGCGTGTLAVRMAAKGAQVTGVDASPAMLAEAQEKAAAEGLEDKITLKFLDATQIEDAFPEEKFDLIVSTLVFSEMTPDQQRFVLDACQNLLASGGKLLIADEVVPSGALTRILFYLVRGPLVLLTWLLTRTSTTSLKSFEEILAERNYTVSQAAAYLSGSLALFEAAPILGAEKPNMPPNILGKLSHRVTLGTLLKDLYLLFFRILPPYPKVQPGLYAVGEPDGDSPVLVTGNFDLTVRRVVQAIDGKVDAWLLVGDSAGINVWCAAGGGYFTAEKVIAAIKTSRLHEVVNHHALILPQLCANGVDGWKIRKDTGWGVHWGPAKAIDIPAYLQAGRKKTEALRQVAFPLKDRLEMVTVTLGFYALLILLPVLIFWRDLFWPVTAALLGLSYFYAVVHLWLPGKDGLEKTLPLTLIAWAGLWAYTSFWGLLPPPQMFHWAVGLTGLSIFTAGEMQGMSPLMRGEQANWGWEGIAAVFLGLVYWLAPLALGWR